MKVDYFGGCPTCGRNDVYLNSDLPWIFGAARSAVGATKPKRSNARIQAMVDAWSPSGLTTRIFVRIQQLRHGPRTVKQMADDLKDMAAEVALAGERHDHSALPRCAVRLRRIADRFMREMEDVGLASDGDIPF